MSMNYDQLKVLLSTDTSNPIFKLFRSKNAPLILGFLYQEFKAKHIITIPNHKLVQHLVDYWATWQWQDETGKLVHEDIEVESRAKRYIREWSDADYIKTEPDEQGIDVHELTSYTEKAIQWLIQLHQQEFVGTESRFKDIIRRLQELIEESTTDVDQKIANLIAKKKQLERQISQIKRTKQVPVFSSTQIQERLYEITKDAKALVSDFKVVESNFKKISRTIYERHSENILARGAIVGYTLDAMDELEDSEQGKSFYAFWEFLKLADQQTELRTLVAQVYALIRTKNISFSDNFLKELKYYLYESGRKVIHSNNKTMEKLNRVLTEDNLLNRQKAQRITQHIKQLAMRLMEHPPTTPCFIAIEGDPILDFAATRPLTYNKVKQQVNFANLPEKRSSEDSEVDFTQLFNPFETKKQVLIERIEHLLVHEERVSLKTVLDTYPLQKGITELLTYFVIASESPKKHHIHRHHQEEILLNTSSKRKIVIPRVIYERE